MLLIGAGSAGAQSIKDLDFLIGEWKVNETLFPGTATYTKTILLITDDNSLKIAPLT